MPSLLFLVENSFSVYVYMCMCVMCVNVYVFLIRSSVVITLTGS